MDEIVVQLYEQFTASHSHMVTPVLLLLVAVALLHMWNVGYLESTCE